MLHCGKRNPRLHHQKVILLSVLPLPDVLPLDSNPKVGFLPHLARAFLS